MNKLMEMIYTIIFSIATIVCYERGDTNGLLLVITGVLLFININTGGKIDNEK